MKFKIFFIVCLIVLCLCITCKDKVGSGHLFKADAGLFFAVFETQVEELQRGIVIGPGVFFEYGPSLDEHFCLLPVRYPVNDFGETLRTIIHVQGSYIPLEGFEDGEEVYFFMASYLGASADSLKKGIFLPKELAKKGIKAGKWKLINPEWGK